MPLSSDVDLFTRATGKPNFFFGEEWGKIPELACFVVVILLCASGLLESIIGLFTLLTVLFLSSHSSGIKTCLPLTSLT